mmetsp:Transcript_41949/g.47676  ORF Transcript_41949/g.47676 Transcript_41949/m.47676 type:complete len:200 (-) Transcript_41949:92-691(-)
MPILSRGAFKGERFFVKKNAFVWPSWAWRTTSLWHFLTNSLYKICIIALFSWLVLFPSTLEGPVPIKTFFCLKAVLIMTVFDSHSNLIIPIWRACTWTLLPRFFTDDSFQVLLSFFQREGSFFLPSTLPCSVPVVAFCSLETLQVLIPVYHAHFRAACWWSSSTHHWTELLLRGLFRCGLLLESIFLSEVPLLFIHGSQ